MADRFKVWKYTWPSSYMGPLDRAMFLMPPVAKIVAVQVQDGWITLWAAVYPDAKLVERHFVLIGTGQEAPAAANFEAHVGTVQLHNGTLVLHVFEEVHNG